MFIKKISKNQNKKIKKDLKKIQKIKNQYNSQLPNQMKIRVNKFKHSKLTDKNQYFNIDNKH